MDVRKSDVIIIGSGMGSLSSAVLLAKEGLKVRIIEQNWIPGGCSSSYPRKHFIFEAGATTLVGLDEGMPLAHLLKETGIQLPAVKLDIPMQVHFPDGEIATRFQDINQWIAEAERVFGKKGQRPFWEYCLKTAKFVWDVSVTQRRFPPETVGDVLQTLKKARPSQLKLAFGAYSTMKSLMEKYGLWENMRFRKFVDEQLLITAQNFAPEVNVLFGATALCYTNFGNYYVNGGMINMVNPLIEYVENKGGEIIYREGVKKVEQVESGYRVTTKNHEFEAKYVVSGIPLNDTLPLMDQSAARSLSKKLLESKELKGAITMGIAFKRHNTPVCLHHQFLLDEPLPGSATDSFFLSLSHPEDGERCGPDELVASISTHVHDPGATQISDAQKEQFEAKIIDILAQNDILKPENILYQHSSTPGGWYKWTHRHKGFVGGYPQYFSIKPWQMVGSRLDKKGAYICGDSTYPGQGIPGATLSGIIAFEKLKGDHL